MLILAYEILEIHGRHFVKIGKKAGLGPTIVRRVIEAVMAEGPQAADAALARMPAGFPEGIHRTVADAIGARLAKLESAWDGL